jgi:HAD superfamily hydrolase (TIGR01509 family)
MERDIKAVLFDMDGVLIDSRHLIEEIWTSVAAKYGIDLTAEFVRDHIHGRPGHYTRDRLFQAFSPEKRLAIKAEVDEMEETAFSPMLPGLGAFIDRLKVHRIPAALVTSSWRQRITNVIEMHALQGFFTVVVDRNDVAHGKPDPQCYQLAAAQLGLAARECLVFEDSVSGVQAGVASGAICLGIGNSEALVESGALARFGDFRSVDLCFVESPEGSLTFSHDGTSFRLGM